MKARVKKIVARETLIFIGILLITGLCYLTLSGWNYYRNKQLSNLTIQRTSIELEIDSINNEMLKDSMFVVNPDYLGSFFAKYVRQGRIDKNQESSFVYWLSKIKDNEQYKRGVFNNYVLNLNKQVTFEKWESTLFIDSIISKLESKELNQSHLIQKIKYQDEITDKINNKSKMLIDTNQVTIWFAFAFLVLVYPIRLFITITIWSYKTLRSNED